MTAPGDARDILRVERPRDGLAVVTLNRPDALNALSWDLRLAIIEAFAALKAEGDVSVVILTGAGRGFCAGLDLREMATNPDILTSVASHSPIAALEGFSGVVIGAINGVAVTGGFELALACDILIASDTARFADTHVRVGALPGWGLSQRLSRAVGVYRAKRLSLTGEFLSAQDACGLGLVSEVVAGEALLDRAKGLADHLLEQPAEMLRAYKRLIDEGFAVDFAQARTLETARSTAHNDAVAPASIADRRQSIQAQNLREDRASGRI